MPGAFPDLARGFFSYDSDDGQTYQIATSVGNGNAGAFSPIAPGAFPTYPRGWKMRRVYGVSGSGARTSLPIGNTGNPLFQVGGSFTKDGQVYTVQGKRGEDRFNKGG